MFRAPVAIAACGLYLVLLGAAPPAAAQRSNADNDRAQREYLAAAGMLQRGLNDLAVDAFRSFLESHPRHARTDEARYGLAVGLYRTGRCEAALPELKRLRRARDFPFAAEVLAMQSQCCLAQQEYAGAVEAGQQLLERFETHELADEAGAACVEALYRAGRHEEASTAAESFAQRWPQSPLASRVRFIQAAALAARSEWKAAGAIAADLAQRGPDEAQAAQAWLLYAQCCDQLGQAEDAGRAYRAALDAKVDALAPRALLGLAGVELRAARFDQAAAWIADLEQRFPDAAQAPDASLLRARVGLERGDFDAAEPLLKRVLEAAGPQADQAAFWLAKCKLRQRQFAPAAAVLKQAIETWPESSLLPEMTYDRAVALAEGGDDEAALDAAGAFVRKYAGHALAGGALQLLAQLEHRRRHYERSLDWCTKFLAEPANPQSNAARAAIEFLAGENEFLLGRYEDAARRFQLWLDAGPEGERTRLARYRLGMALHRLDRDDDALPHLSAAADGAETEPRLRDSLLALGDIAFERKDWAAAERWLAQFVQTDLKAAGVDDALLRLGLVRARQNHPEEALQAFDQLLASHPDSPQRTHAAFERAQCLLSLSRDEEAERALLQVVEQDASADGRFATHALQHLGALAMRRNQPQAAAQYYEKLQERRPDAGLASEAAFQRAQALLSDQRFAEAERQLRGYLERHADEAHAAAARALLGIVVARQDRFADALPLLEAAGKLDPPEALRRSASYERAWCLRQLQRADDARTAFRELIDELPECPERVLARLELAELEAARGRCDAARPLLSEVRALGQSSPSAVPAEVLAQATYRLGVCELQADRAAAAAELLEAFLSSGGRAELIPSALYFAGEARAKAGQFDAAARHFSRLVESHGDDASGGPALLRLGDCLAALQQWERSERVFAQYLSRFSDSEFAYQAQFGQGWARENQGRYDEAIAAYQSIVERHKGPTAARAQFQIGECLFAKKDLDAAVRELLKVDILYAYPEWSAAALFEAGRCFEALGKPVEAREQYRRVRDDFADSKWAKPAAERLSKVAGGALPHQP